MPIIPVQQEAGELDLTEIDGLEEPVPRIVPRGDPARLRPRPDFGLLRRLRRNTPPRRQRGWAIPDQAFAPNALIQRHVENLRTVALRIRAARLALAPVFQAAEANRALVDLGDNQQLQRAAPQVRVAPAVEALGLQPTGPVPAPIDLAETPQLDRTAPRDFHSYVHGTIDRATAGLRLRATYIAYLHKAVSLVPISPADSDYKARVTEKLEKHISDALTIKPGAVSTMHAMWKIAELVREAQRIAADNLTWEMGKAERFPLQECEELLKSAKSRESSLRDLADNFRTVIRDLERLEGDA